VPASQLNTIHGLKIIAKGALNPPRSANAMIIGNI
jgi:hypothetical protein